jgi:transposase-like protein
MLQELVEAELSARTGAEWNEQIEARTEYRNGRRDKALITQSGDLDLAIPKLRSGTFCPSLLVRRRRTVHTGKVSLERAYAITA